MALKFKRAKDGSWVAYRTEKQEKELVVVKKPKKENATTDM